MRHTTLVFHLIFWALYDLAYVIDSKTHVFFPYVWHLWDGEHLKIDSLLQSLFAKQQ